MHELTKAELAHRVQALEAIATLAKKEAGRYRIELGARAVSELEQEGVAPSWRTPTATVSLPISVDRAAVADETAFTNWVKATHPTEVVEVVRPAFVERLLGSLVFFRHDALHAGRGNSVRGDGSARRCPEACAGHTWQRHAGRL